jgi:acetylornithine deacetylase/succinyl-diaminopimelate desuccinylase-like protein
MEKLTRLQAYGRIKKLLLGEQKFEQAKLEDGTIVMWDGSLETGTALFVVAEDGTQMPAPDDEHKLEDGSLVSTVGGLVVTVTPAEAEGKAEIEVEEKKNEEMASEMEMLVEKLAEKVAALEAKIEEMGKKPESMSTEDLNAKVDALNEEIASKFKSVVDLVSQISEAPAADPVQNVKSGFKKERKNSIEDIAKAIQSIKN